MLKQLPPTYMLKQLPTYLYAQTTPHLPISSKNLPPTYMLKQLPTAHVLHDKEDPVAVVEWVLQVHQERVPKIIKIILRSGFNF